MEAQEVKGQRCPIQEGEADHPAVKDCIKQLNSNCWLLGPSLILEYDVSSNTFSTSFKSEKSTFEWLPVNPQGPIQLVRCISGQATWKIGDWAYFKIRIWTEKMGMEHATLEFIQNNAPSIPVPTVLEHYVDETSRQSYILTSSLSGIDLNDAWKTLNYKQKYDVTNQVAEHIYTLAQLKSERLETADKKWVNEPFFSLLPWYWPIQISYSKMSPEERHVSHLVNPDKSQEYEKIWGNEENMFVFCHLNLGPLHIKIIVNEDGKINVTGISNWENAGFVPRAWISTKLYVSRGLGFDWNGEEGEHEWQTRLRRPLAEMGFSAYPEEWLEWRWKYGHLQL